MDVYLEAVKDLEADEVGIEGVLEDEVGELHQTSHILQIF